MFFFHTRVDVCHFFLEQFRNIFFIGKIHVGGEGYPAVLGPFTHHDGIDVDQGGHEIPFVTKNNRLFDVGAEFEFVLQEHGGKHFSIFVVHNV